VNDKFVSAVKYQHYRFEKTALCIESKAELPSRAVIVEILDPDSPRRRLQNVFGGNSVLECRIMNIHAA
jgi:hypothetical protein